jgi:hypothetical protein
MHLTTLLTSTRRALRPFAVLTLVAVTATVAFAAVRLSRTSFTDEGTTLSSCGRLTGLGNQDVTIVMSTTGAASTSCTNPGGNNPPGQQVPVSPSGSTTIPSTQIKNGSLSFCVETIAPSVTAEEAGCPRPFTAQVTDVQFETATMTVMQGGEVVLSQTFDPSR